MTMTTNGENSHYRIVRIISPWAIFPPSSEQGGLIIRTELIYEYKVKRGNSGHSLVLTDSLAHNFGNKIARARKI